MNNIINDILEEWKRFYLENKSNMDKRNNVVCKIKKCLYKNYVLTKRRKNISNYLLKYGHVKQDLLGIRDSLRKSIVNEDIINNKDDHINSNENKSNKIYLEDVVLKLNVGSKKRMKFYNEKSFSLTKKEDVKDISGLKKLISEHKQKNNKETNVIKDGGVKDNEVLENVKEESKIQGCNETRIEKANQKDEDKSIEEKKCDDKYINDSEKKIEDVDKIEDIKVDNLISKNNLDKFSEELASQENYKEKEKMSEKNNLQENCLSEEKKSHVKDVVLDTQSKLSKLDISMIQKPKTSIFNEKYKEIKKLRVKDLDLKKENERINFLFKIAKKEIEKKNQTLMMKKPKSNNLEVSRLKTLFSNENNKKIDKNKVDKLPEKKLNQNVDLIYDVKTSKYISDKNADQRNEAQENINEITGVFIPKRSEIITKDSLELSKLPHKKRNKDTVYSSNHNDLYRQVIDNERTRHKDKQIEYKPSTIIPYIKSDDEDDILHIEPEFVTDKNINEIVRNQNHEEIEKYFNCGSNIDIVVLFPNIKDVSNDSPNKWI